jgi:tetratricopeptide (TPR) repeat protein
LTEQAFELAQEQDLHLALQAMNNMANIYFTTGHLKRALRLYELILSTKKETGNADGEAAILGNLALAYNETGHPQEALRMLEQALSIAKEGGTHAEQAPILNNMASVYFMMGHVQGALHVFEQALSINREAGNRAGEAASLSNIAMVHTKTGSPQEALRLFEQALSITKELADRDMESSILNNMAGVYNETGHSQEALHLYEQALPIKREIGDRAGEAAILNNMAYLYQSLRRYSESRETFEESIAISRDIGHPAGQVAGLVGLALLLYHSFGQVQEATMKMELALAIMREYGLSQDSVGRTLEQIEQALQGLRSELWSSAQLGGRSTLSLEDVRKFVSNTIAVMTSAPDRRGEWRETIIQALPDSQQIELDFFNAILAILDGRSPRLLADHPYAQTVAAIQRGIADGGEESVYEPIVGEVMVQLAQYSVVALRGGPQEKMALMQELAPFELQANDGGFGKLIHAIKLALVGGDLTTLGSELDGVYKDVWEAIVWGVQADGR